MPSKALLRPEEALAAARRVPGAAAAITGGVDVEAPLGSRDAFSSDWDDKYQVQWVESTGATLVRGHQADALWLPGRPDLTRRS